MSQAPFPPPQNGSATPGPMSYAAMQPNATPTGSGGDPGLDQPWYGIGMGAAYVRPFKKYIVFRGRASRGEYWWWVLANALITLVAGIILYLFGTDWAVYNANPSIWWNQVFPTNVFGKIINVVWWIYDLVIILPWLAVAMRRLHDTDHSGWWLLLCLIPVIGWIWLVVLLAGRTKPSRY